MPSPAAKRAASARKAPSSAAAPSSKAAGGFADPQTVEAVRRATVALITGLQQGRGVARELALRGAGFTAREIWPRLRDGSVFLATGFVRVLGFVVGGLWTQRRVLARIGHRGLWWGALAILVIVGRALLSAEGDPELVGLALTYLAAGLSMSVLVLLSAPETRMRVAAFALASGHGSLAALAWVAIAS